MIPGHEYADFDGMGLAHLIRQRELTPMELVDAAIARVEELNPRLNAVIFSAYDQARQRAKMNLTGPLAGVPILLKDIPGHKQGWPTRQGSGFLPATGSMHDSTLVARYEAAGLIALGKTNVPEFGLLPITESSLYGPARNPWNPDRSPGVPREGRRSQSQRAWYRSHMLMTEAVLFESRLRVAGSSASNRHAPVRRLDPNLGTL